MKRPVSVRFVMNAALAAAYFASPAGGFAQQKPSPSSEAVAAETAMLSHAIEDLKEQVQGLRAAMIEMRDQLSAAHQEAQALRREIRNARGQLVVSGPGLRNSETPVLDFRGEIIPAALPSQSLPSEPAEEAALSDQVTKLQGQVATVEEDQELLSSKLASQYQTKVESGSKYRVRVSGIALFNASSTRGAVDNLDLPLIARTQGPLDTGGSFGATARQSLLGLEVFGPTVGGARTSGDLQFDFYGGFPTTLDGVTAGLVRLRTARMSLDWPHISVVAGQDIPFFSPLSPSSLASTAYPAFSYSGNLWTWTPQVRLERRISVSEGSSFLVQGGILDPLTGELPTSQSYRSPQAGEKSRGPAYAARTSWTREAFGRTLTVGIGGYSARQNWGFNRAVDSWAATADWDVPLGRWFLLSGEFYRGRAMGGLGGAEGRSVLFNGALADARTRVLGLNAAGGWSQVKFKPLERVEFNAAFGKDSPFASDLRRFFQSQSYIYSTLGRNEGALLNVIYRARSNVLLSVEYRRLRTYDTSRSEATADHVNFSAGVLF